MAQDKGVFESHSNSFYRKIVRESKIYDQIDNASDKSFKMRLDDKEIPASIEEFIIVASEEPVSQGNTGTCWCFSTISFYESEIQRITGKRINLSELYLVYFEYIEKAREYINTRGKSHLGEGSETNAVQRMMKIYGIVPLEAYAGKPSNQPYHCL